jgi:hypothetical protein
LIIFVIETERVQDQIHAQAKGHFTLSFAPRHDRMRVVAEIVTLERTAEIMPTVHEGQAPSARDALEISRAFDATYGPGEEVKRSIEDVLIIHARQRLWPECTR